MERLEIRHRSCLQAAMPGIGVLLTKDEETAEEVQNSALSLQMLQMCTQLYYVLVLLTRFRALDKVQVSGEGEGATDWS